MTLFELRQYLESKITVLEFVAGWVFVFGVLFIGYAVRRLFKLFKE